MASRIDKDARHTLRLWLHCLRPADETNIWDQWYDVLRNLSNSLLQGHLLNWPLIRFELCRPAYDLPQWIGKSCLGCRVVTWTFARRIGSLIHDLAHIIQNYQNCPSWLKGIPECVPYLLYLRAYGTNSAVPDPEVHYTTACSMFS